MPLIPDSDKTNDPKLRVLFVPSRVILEVPIVKMPVILASPFTISSVVAPPITVFPIVETPERIELLFT